MSPKTRGPQPLASPLASPLAGVGVDGRKDRLDGHHLTPSPLADREPARSGFQPYRPSPADETRALPPHASPHAPPHAPPPPPPFSMDPAAHSPLAYNPYALYPAQLHQAYRLEEQLYLERCGMLRSPHSLYPSYPVGAVGGLSSLYGLQGLQGLRYPPALPDVLPGHLGMLSPSPAMAAERLKLEEEHRLRLRDLREEEKDRERERDREQREQRERDREDRERDSALSRREKGKRASPAPSHTALASALALSHHDSTARRPPVVGLGLGGEPSPSPSATTSTTISTTTSMSTTSGLLPVPTATTTTTSASATTSSFPYAYGPYAAYPTPLSSLSSFATSLTSTLTSPLASAGPHAAPSAPTPPPSAASVPVITPAVSATPTTATPSTTPSSPAPLLHAVHAVHSVPVSIPLTMLGSPVAYSPPFTTSASSAQTTVISVPTATAPSVIEATPQPPPSTPSSQPPHPCSLPLHPQPAGSGSPFESPASACQNQSSSTTSTSSPNTSSTSTTSVIMSTSKLLLPASPATSTTTSTTSSMAAALTIGSLLSTSPAGEPSAGLPFPPRVSAIVSTSTAAPPPPPPPSQTPHQPPAQAPSQPQPPRPASRCSSETASAEGERAATAEAAEADPKQPQPQPPPAIVKQLHQLTALSLMQSSLPVIHAPCAARNYNFQKKEEVVSRLDQVERRRKEMQLKRLETRSRQKQPRFVKQRARQDLVVHRHPALTAVPVASVNGSNGLALDGGALTDDSESDSEAWWDDPKLDVQVTSGPPTPLHAPLEKLDFLGYFGLTTIDRRQYLELQRLLNGSDRMASALLEDADDHLEQSANGLLLPLPAHPPEVVCGGVDYSSKVQFLRELELKATTRREREDSESYWLACEGEKSRRGSNCKIAKYLLTYREFRRKKAKHNSVPASQRDYCKPVASRHVPSICDKLLGLSFPGIGVSASSPQSYLPLIRSSLPCVLDVVLPAMLSQPNGESPGSDSESCTEDAIEKEDDKWPGIEAIFSSYINYHKRTNIELSVLRSHTAKLKEKVAMKRNEFNFLEQKLKDLAMIKTSHDVERMRMQNCLDSLSSYLNGLKTNLRYKKPC